MTLALGERIAAEDADDLVYLVQLRDLVDEQLTAAAVRMNVKHGWTWQAIGDALGITRQAAQQRFGRRAQAAATAGKEETPGQLHLDDVG
jgi:hypothetical protein